MLWVIRLRYVESVIDLSGRSQLDRPAHFNGRAVIPLAERSSILNATHIWTQHVYHAIEKEFCNEKLSLKSARFGYCCLSPNRQRKARTEAQQHETCWQAVDARLKISFQAFLSNVANVQIKSYYQGRLLSRQW